MSEHSLIFGLGVRVFFNGIPCWLVGYKNLVPKKYTYPNYVHILYYNIFSSSLLLDPLDSLDKTKWFL